LKREKKLPGENKTPITVHITRFIKYTKNIKLPDGSGIHKWKEADRYGPDNGKILLDREWSGEKNPLLRKKRPAIYSADDAQICDTVKPGKGHLTAGTNARKQHVKHTAFPAIDPTLC
jgi:hypothetical protein